MEIRDLRESDAAAWWQIRLESLELEPFAFGEAVEEHRLIAVETVARRFRDVAAGCLHLGAFEDGKLIGMATFLRDTGLTRRHKGHIFGVYVTASHRGKGVGRAVLSVLLDRVKQDGSLEQILLTAATCQNPAQQLYREFGFEVYGTEPHARKVGSAYIDEDQMVLRLR